MDPHSVDGTQRLEEPVSRTTLNVCGGVPIAISEKSRLLSDSEQSSECAGTNIGHSRSLRQVLGGHLGPNGLRCP